MQTRTQSAIESCTTVAVGFTLSLALQYVTFPWFGIELPAHDHVAITCIFTVASLVRSYVMRRAFVRWHR